MKRIQAGKTLTMVFLLAAAATACAKDSRRDATTVGHHGWVFEGWACAPEPAMIKKRMSPAHYCAGKPAEFLYVKFTARAADKVIGAGNENAKQASCRAIARRHIKNGGIAKILDDIFHKTCTPYHVEPPGPAIRKTLKKAGPPGIYDCCAIDQYTGRCAASAEDEDWRECSCVAYLRFPGGRKGFEEAIKKAKH